MRIAPTDVDAARRQLERVLARPGFVRNERMRRFLRFLAERHLEGNDGQLKESVIAVEVFGRRPDHDPSQDSIVRTEAGRLRARLAEYYMGDGLGDALIIRLPKGGYTPSFELRHSSSEQTLGKQTRWRLWLAAAAVAIAVAIAGIVWLRKTELLWQNPVEGAQFQSVTDFDGSEQAAAISRDGKFVAFLSDRDGHTDVWVTQPGSGQFHNLTHGWAPELVNPSVRTLGFSPNGALVAFWTRKPANAGGQIGVWAVPTLGGQPKPYLENAAEFDWSHDGSRLTYHTPARGDPLFVLDGAAHAHGPPIFTAPTGLHSHFPAISPDGGHIAFSVHEGSATLLYVMQADGTNKRVVADSLDLQGSPAWNPDGRHITAAANDRGAPHLFQVPIDGGPPTVFVRDYSVDPAWEPCGRFVVYSGPDIGTTLSVRAVTPAGIAHPLPRLTTLTRGARHVKFLLGGRELAFLRGGIDHKDLWLADPETGAERQVTTVADDFDIQDFDISADGREVILERMQERSDVVLLDLARR